MAYGSFIGNVLMRLEQYGLTDVIIPFLLIFTILYAMLLKAGIFGGTDEGLKKKFNVVIALSITLLSVVPHVTGMYKWYDIVEIINATFPQIALLITSIVMVLILLGVTGKWKNTHNSQFVALITIVAVAIVGIIFARAIWPGTMPFWLGFLDDPNLQAAILTILAFGLIVGYVTGTPTPATGGGKKGWEKLQEFLGKDD